MLTTLEHDGHPLQVETDATILAHSNQLDAATKPETDCMQLTWEIDSQPNQQFVLHSYSDSESLADQA